MDSTSASLLDRLHANADATAWDRLASVYSPLIRHWLRKHGIRDDDAEDLLQEVMVVVVRRFPDFEHNQRTGAFRTWLRTIAVNVTRDFWKANRLRPKAPGGSDFGSYLDQVADPNTEQTKQWDHDHDVFVMQKLLDMLRPQFDAKTWEAFRRVAIDREPAAQVAGALGVTTNAVFIAKSRVLAKLREEAAGLVE